MNQNFQPQNTFHQKPRVSDYKFQSPEIMQKFREEDRIQKAIKLDLEQLEGFPCNDEFFKMHVEPVLSATDFCFYDVENSVLYFLRFIDGFTKIKLLEKLENNLEFGNFIEANNKIAKEAYEQSIANTHARVEENKDFRTLVEETEKEVLKKLSEAREEKKQIAAQKAKPARVYSEQEKQAGIQMQEWTLEDLGRSKQNLFDKKISIKKEVKRLDAENNTIDEKIWPLVEKKEELEKMLEGDLSEEKFKNFKLSIEYNEDKIEKYRREMMPFFEQIYELNQELEKIDNQLPMLDCLIDMNSLKKDAFVNFPRRRERLLQRVYKFLKERTEIETIRIKLNNRWKDLTGDREDLVPVLGLKSDSKMFFI